MLSSLLFPIIPKDHNALFHFSLPERPVWHFCNIQAHRNRSGCNAEKSYTRVEDAVFDRTAGLAP